MAEILTSEYPVATAVGLSDYAPQYQKLDLMPGNCFLTQEDDKTGLPPSLLPAKTPCCSVVNLSGQPLISVGMTGSYQDVFLRNVVTIRDRE